MYVTPLWTLPTPHIMFDRWIGSGIDSSISDCKSQITSFKITELERNAKNTKDQSEESCSFLNDPIEPPSYEHDNPFEEPDHGQ